MCGSCCLCFQACETANALNDSGFLYCLLRYTSWVDSSIAYSGTHLGQVPLLPTQVHIQGRFLYCLLRYTSRVGSSTAYSGTHLGQVPLLPTQVHIQGRFLYCLLRYTSRVGSSTAYSGTHLGQVPLQTSQVHIWEVSSTAYSGTHLGQVPLRTSQVHILGRFLYRLLRYISREVSSTAYSGIPSDPRCVAVFIVNTIKVIFKSKLLLNWKL